MTRERFNHLLDMVDELNEKLKVDASLDHSKYGDRLHITLFYVPTVSRVFNTYKYMTSDWDYTGNDTDLIKGEAFMRMLLASAEHFPEMRCER